MADDPERPDVPPFSAETSETPSSSEIPAKEDTFDRDSPDISPTLLQNACRLSPSPSTSEQKNDSGIQLGNPPDSPDDQVQGEEDNQVQSPENQVLSPDNPIQAAADRDSGLDLAKTQKDIEAEMEDMIEKDMEKEQKETAEGGEKMEEDCCVAGASGSGSGDAKTEKKTETKSKAELNRPESESPNDSIADSHDDVEDIDVDAPGPRLNLRRRRRRIDSHDDDPDTPDESSRTGDESTGNLRRRRRLLLDTESSSENTSDNSSEYRSENGEAGLLASSDDSSHVNDDSNVEWREQLVADIPKDTWNPLRQLMKRELGYSNRYYSSFMQREETGASINLVRRLKLWKTLKHHEGCVNSLHFNSTGSLLASGSDDLNIVIWDWAHQKPYMVFDSGHRSNVFQSKFVPHCGDSLLVTCARDGAIRLAELSTTGECRGTKKLAQHRGAAHKLALLDDSPHMCYSCGEDAVVYQIDLRQNTPNKLCVTKEKGRKIPLYSVHTQPLRTNEFCVAGRDPYIRIYDTRMIREEEEGDEMSCVKKFCPHHLMSDSNNMTKANVTCAVYNWNGTEVIGTYNDEDIYMFNTEHSDGANYIHKYAGHRNNATVKGVNFYGPKSEFIVSGSDCGNVFLWEKNSTKIVNFFDGDEGGVVNVLEPHPHNPYLATSGLDHDVKIFLPTAEEPNNLEGLKGTMRRNERQRREQSSEPDMIDGHMMWVLLHHLRRSARDQARQGGGGGGDEEEDSSSSDDEHDRYDDSDPDGAPQQCATS